jgi:hypothetical protein
MARASRVILLFAQDLPNKPFDDFGCLLGFALKEKMRSVDRCNFHLQLNSPHFFEAGFWD